MAALDSFDCDQWEWEATVNQEADGLFNSGSLPCLCSLGL